MGVLSALEPEKVFYYFEEITKIPHGSGNVEQISDYLVDFAKERNIEVIQDELKNVIMISEATQGYENEPALIIQGHMDMVAVHKPELAIDMTKEPLKIAVNGDDIYAEGTSLGGDDGIAVAYALAILDSPEIKHPKLEFIFTVDEEVGMDGARGIDVSMLEGKRLLNLDSEEEGIFLASCAGGARVDAEIPLIRTVEEGIELNIRIGGLQGGHSGCEIHKERGNANMLMARAFVMLAKTGTVSLVSCEGGQADNAIPRECMAKLLVKPGFEKTLEVMLMKLQREWKAEFESRDPDVVIDYSWGTQSKTKAACGIEFERIANFLYSLPNGVQAMSMDIPGLVETSLNLGILRMEEDIVQAEFAVRSSVESSKKALIQKIVAVTSLSGGTINVYGNYPGWSYKKDSAFRDKLVRIYAEMYGNEPKVEAIHAGLECGLLAGKIPGLDCISMGPDMKDIHTTEESLSISSTKRVWEYIIRVLESKEK